MNILIVDDDIMIRNLLSILIKQINDFSGNIYGVSDADEAEMFCAAKAPDLVITDISMPNRSGLDLIQSLRKKYPELQIACLSAYDDYDYIRKALQSGVLDYILKSEMKLEDIVSLLSKVKSFSGLTPKTIIEESKITEMKAVNADMERVMDDDENDLCGLEVYEKMKWDPTSRCTVLAFQLGHQNTSEEDLFKAQCVAEKTLLSEQKVGFTFAFEGERIIMLLLDSADSIETRENEMMRLSLLYKRNLAEYTNQDVVVSIFETVPNRYQLKRIINKTIDSMDAIEYYQKGSDSVKQLKSIEGKECGILNQLIEAHDARLDMSAISSLLLSEIRDYHIQFVVPREVKRTSLCALFYLMERFDKSRTMPESILAYNRYVRRIRYARKSEDLEQVLQEAFEKILTSNPVPETGIIPSVQLAIQYIHENYDQKISLDDIARQIYHNRTYTSQMFKKYTKMNFVDYLEMVRIDKAKEMLLETNLPVIEIAARVGYSNQSYFTKIFKQNTGLSPKVFRSSSQKDEFDH